MVATYLCNIVGINTNSINSINQVLQFKEGLHGYPLKTVYVFFVLRKAITKHISPIANPKPNVNLSLNLFVKPFMQSLKLIVLNR